MMDEIQSQTNFDQTLLNLFDALNDRPIVYHGIYSQIMGTTSAGLVTSQLIYWSKVMGHQQFYKTDAEICDELKMGSKELRNAKRRIVESGVFELSVKGVPPKTYYQINLKKLINLINEVQTKSKETGRINLAQRDKLESPEGINQFSPKGQIITEMTSQMTKKDNNNGTKSIRCAMATGKKLSHMEPRPVTKPKPLPEPKAKPNQETQEPNGSVVVNCEIDDLIKMVKGWAISRVMLENWAKQHGVGYVLQKIELTNSAIGLKRVKRPGAYLNKAIELDWLPPAPHEDKESKNIPMEPAYPTHEENVTWYDKLAENEKITVLSEAVRKNPYLEGHLKNANTSVLDTDFSGTAWFKMMMSNVGRAK
jgi:hypothetical protein